VCFRVFLNAFLLAPLLVLGRWFAEARPRKREGKARQGAATNGDGQGDGHAGEGGTRTRRRDTGDAARGRSVRSPSAQGNRCCRRRGGWATGREMHSYGQIAHALANGCALLDGFQFRPPFLPPVFLLPPSPFPRVPFPFPFLACPLCSFSSLALRRGRLQLRHSRSIASVRSGAVEGDTDTAWPT
jgi:hypothetical protein